MDRLIKEHQRV